MLKFKKRIISMFALVALFTFIGNVSASDDSIYDFSKELSFREQFGLNTDISTIRSLQFEEEKSSTRFGVKLTETEEKELVNRINTQSEKLPLIKGYLDNYEKNNTLVFIDQKSGGIVNIGIKGENDLSKHEADLKKIYGDSNMVRVFNTKYSEEDLNELNEKLIKHLNKDFNGVTITDTSVNLLEQKIEVGVKNFDESKKALLEQSFNSDMLLIRESAVVSDNDDRNSTYNPLQAGTKIVNTNTNAYCSIGFLAKPTNSISGYIITAAHCGSAGNSFKQGTNNVGSLGARYYGGKVDAAAIGTSSLSYSNDLYTNTSRGGYFDLVQSSDNDYVGEMVCMSGASSANNSVSCGVLKSRSTSYSINGTNFVSMRAASYTSNGGDSGAPTYYSTILKGVHKGTYNGDAIYSHVEYVLSALQMNAILN